MKNAILILALLLGLTACTPAVASPTNPALTETFVPPTEIDSTLTPTPEFTPTSEIAQPSVPNGLRPENAASQTLENGVWTVKNADGKVTATWNAETQTWTYAPENIKVQQVIIGNDVDRSIIEPFLGPLPPDDPTTHFKDENGNPVEYGIGPETRIDSFGSAGNLSDPATEIFIRFRGIASIGSNMSALILEMPQSPDTSTLMVLTIDNDNYTISGTPDDSMVWSQYTHIGSRSWRGNSGIQTANKQLVGHMVMIIIIHDSAESVKGTRFYESSVIADANAKAFLDFLSGSSTRAPRLDLYDLNTNIDSRTIVPESQLPQP